MIRGLGHKSNFPRKDQKESHHPTWSKLPVEGGKKRVGCGVVRVFRHGYWDQKYNDVNQDQSGHSDQNI